jgi:Domain of unknown function (DUF5050)
MPTEVPLPQCYLECFQYLYPTIDFSEVHFYVGVPTPYSWAVSTMCVTLTWGYGSGIHIYTEPEYWTPGDTTGDGRKLFLALAHECVHVLQIKNLDDPSLWIPRYLWRYVISGFTTDCPNPIEAEAYHHANGCIAPELTTGAIEACVDQWAGRYGPCQPSASDSNVLTWTMFNADKDPKTYLEMLRNNCSSLVMTKSSEFTSTNWITKTLGAVFSLLSAPTSSEVSFWSGIAGAAVGLFAGGLVGAIIGWVVGGLLGVLANWISGFFGGSSNLLMKEYVRPDGSGAINLGGYQAQSTPFLANGFAYFQGTDNTLWKVDASTGSGTKLAGYKSQTAPVVGTDGYVYFQGTDNTLWKISAVDGSSATKVAGYQTSNTPCVPGDGYVYFQGTDNKLWKVETSGANGVNLGGYKTKSTPVVASDGFVYFQGTDNTLWRIDATSGVGASVSGYKTNSKPCVPGDGYVYFQGTDNKLWKVPTIGSGGTNLGGYKTNSSPCVPGDGFVYFQGTDNTFWKIDATSGTGAPVSGAQIASTPFVPNDGYAYFQAH